MGGPLWSRKQERAWTIPKGEFIAPEEPIAAARREFTEELGLAPPAGEFSDLGSVRQSGGKVVTVFAVVGDVDLTAFSPGTFSMPWPPKSTVLQEFPELDRVAWVRPEEARGLLVAAQAEFIDRLLEAITPDGG
jgi:predicted NUDIX family NTP pyrophosphohydrolase